ncbi:GPI-anchored protein LLG1-like [Panicum virgatum]|uniref:GPI-anchored protein LLG1-like domain-containing protein n=1 Tax=Panicum virgatum TaxID=38727 RepID=A0A8T0Q074_PANVG|nr:GPI-anchored protein LLG1-like [Panicum virgatum]KAG2566568.1 hypothetical protein PVAP13_7NG184634 [Panicum virgatum]
MGLHRGIALRAAVLAAVLGFAAAGFISNDALLEHGHAATGRSLLQAKKDCPVSFEDANYTIITSRCKGPLYQPSLCCGALKDFACPYSTYINDVTTNCASTMFSYINLYGKYPPGLFANTCHEGDKGLSCPEDTPQVQPGQKASGAAIVIAQAAAMAVAAALAVSLIMSC